jgi:hypothetical protein
MYGQILDSYRQAAESTMQFQQTMMRNWAQQWPQMMGGASATPGSAWLEQAHNVQKKWSESYKAGIKLIEDSFRLGEAKDPEQLRKLVEELWKHGLESLKSVTEDQMREFQNVMQTWMDMASKGASALKG